MKRNLLKYVGNLLVCTALLGACSPNDEAYTDISRVDLSTVKQIKLRASHNMLLANGEAVMEFHPELHRENDYIVPDYRVNRDELEYYSLSGERLAADFKTADASLIGKKIEVYAKIKETGIISDTVSFQVVAPGLSSICTEKTVPVIFHIVQTDKELASYGGSFTQERIQKILEKLNNTFSNLASTNATGIDSKIRFKLAAYNSEGKRLQEPGINRVTVASIDAADDYASFIQSQHLMWPYQDYLNIWVISAPELNDGNFGPKITARCRPRYVYSESAAKPEGIAWSVVAADWEPVPEEVGIIFKMQVFNKQTWDFSDEAENELVYFLGGYYGLLQTWSTSDSQGPEDYCLDTFGYTKDSKAYKGNETRYKSVDKYFFLSENIMDDPTGMHRSVSREQCERMHWVMTNCPERSAWKSDFALTGK